MTEPASTVEDDGLPIVAHDTGNRPLWIGIAIILLGGVALFAALEGNRTAATAPSVKPRVADLSSTPSQIPDLFVPPERQVFIVPQEATAMPQATVPAPRAAPTPVAPTPPSSVAPRSDPAQPVYPPPAPKPATDRNAPVIVYEAGSTTTAATGQPGTEQRSSLASRARAMRTGDRTYLVAQGTIIQAVLETALDSTQPGQVRALVSRDVRNARGDKVLIPKGSRLYGDYKADISSGQKRANVQWSRLLRPDGVAIQLDSPATDELGRAGIGGRVDTHFLERFGGALLQSSLDIGVIAATRQISDSSVILALPSSVQGATSQLVPQAPKPTLRVKQGTRISVFVSRDLDFSGVGEAE